MPDTPVVPIPNSKKWYQSKTVWATIATTLIAIYNLLIPAAASFGYTLPAIPHHAYAVLGVLGLYGRITADTTIGGQ